MHFSYTHVLQDGSQYTDLYEASRSFIEMTQKLQGVYTQHCVWDIYSRELELISFHDSMIGLQWLVTLIIAEMPKSWAICVFAKYMHDD